MEYKPMLETGNYYHIYNCGINGEVIFKEAKDYLYFLMLFEKYILTVADTFAWCLMGNHFHLLVQIKENIVYTYKPDEIIFVNEDEKWLTTDSLNVEDVSLHKIPNATKHFSHLFSTYSKYYNKKYSRHGGLFERSFKRKLINEEKYFKTVVIYIHSNPVHHGFCEQILDYPWTSYNSCLSEKPTKIVRSSVIDWFDDKENFKAIHLQKINSIAIEKFLELD